MKDRLKKLGEYPVPEIIYFLLCSGVLIMGMITWSDIGSGASPSLEEIYYTISLLLSSVLSFFFFILGRTRDDEQHQAKMDPGYVWLAVGMLVWQLTAWFGLDSIVERLSPSTNDKDLLTQAMVLPNFLLNIANSLALLAAIKYFDLLEEKPRWDYGLVSWFQRTFKSAFWIRSNVIIIIMLLVGFFWIWLASLNIPISKSASQYIAFSFNFFVCFFLFISLNIIFSEREIPQLRWLAGGGLTLVLIYEAYMLPPEPLTNNWLLKPETIKFIYKILLFIIFFSLIVSYRIYKKVKKLGQKEKELVHTAIELVQKEEKIREQEEKYKKLISQLENPMGRTPIEHFTENLIYVFTRHHSKKGSTKALLARVTGTNGIKNTLHESNFNWQRQNLYPVLEVLIIDHSSVNFYAGKNDELAFDHIANRFFKSMCDLEFSSLSILFVAWIVHTRRKKDYSEGLMNLIHFEPKENGSVSPYVLGFANTAMIRFEKWKDYKSFLDTLFLFFNAIFFHNREQENVLLQQTSLSNDPIVEVRFTIQMAAEDRDSLLKKIGSFPESEYLKSKGDTTSNYLKLKKQLGDRINLSPSIDTVNLIDLTFAIV